MFNYWNQSSNGNVIHKDDVKFPNFSQTPLVFPNTRALAPFPKKGDTNQLAPSSLNENYRRNMQFL